MRHCQTPRSATSIRTRACLLIVGLSLLASWPVAAQVSRTLSERTTFEPETLREVQSGAATLVEHYNPSQMLRLTIGLQPPQVAEERQFLNELQTPGKKAFHQFLSAEEWTRRFDPSVEDELAVVNWATAQGLTVTRRFPNRLIVDVEAPAATIERAFNVTMNRYQMGTKTFFANDRDPVIPSNLTGIIRSVGGLQNLQVMRPANKNLAEPAFPDYAPGLALSTGSAGHASGNRSKLPPSLKSSRLSSSRKSNVTGSSNYDSGPPYDPQDMYSTAAYSVQALYNLGHCCNPQANPGQTPPETSIAIATAGTQNGSDFAGFQAQYPYLADHWQQYYIDGTPACCDGEGTMDMEWSTAMSNSFGSYVDTAMVFLYDGANNGFGTFNDIYNTMLTDGYARNFSTSWGWVDATLGGGNMATADAIFSSMVGQGWSLTAASGDGGASYSCQNFDSISFPASDPNVVAAGGATLSMSGGPPPSFNYIVGWSGGPDGCGTNDGGSTGGYSTYFSEPNYQTSAGLSLPSRGNPDIALNADWYNTPQWIYFGGGLSGNGGTSIVAPETVGFFAQENAYLLALGNICGSGGSSPCAPMGAVNPYIYAAGTNAALSNPFYDITSGCNNNDDTLFWGLGYYCAGTGWDAVTGWGAYNFLQLAWAINYQHVPGYSYPVVNFSSAYATNTWYNSDPYVSWTVSSPADNGYPSPGTSGFTQEWDADPGNPTKEATPGYSGFPSNPYNAFYDGPQYPNSTSGCLDLLGSFCANGIGGVQGFHTVYIRAWGNEGENRLATYGPIGYDTIPPVTTASLSGSLIGGTTYKSAVTVTLSASDPGYPSTGSGVSITWYHLNNGGWQHYTGPFTVGYAGSYTVYFFSYDVAGNSETVKPISFKINPALSLSPGGLGFGNQVLGTTSAGKSVTITNITSSSISLSSIAPSGDFTVTASTCGASLGVGGHCSVTLAFKPSVVGGVSGDLTVAYTGGVGSPDRLGLTGTGLVPLAATPTSLAFGTVTVGSSSVKSLTLKNDNPSTALSISFSANGDYSTAAGGGTPCGASLAGAASCTINVTFKPHQNGAINGAVSVTDHVSLSPLIVALSGSGSGAGASALSFTPSSLTFANIGVGAGSTKTVTVKNVSASSVKISATSNSGDYTASGCITTLLPAATCTLSVTFTPSASGSINGAIGLTDNATVTPEILDVSGTAVLPLTISPSNVNFGGWTVGSTSSTSTLTLTNNTAASMSIASTGSGDFTAVAGGGTPCGASLGAKASCTILVSFSPTTTGTITGVATVTYSGGYNPQEVKLSGTGQ
jgi:hypothetical protein